MESTANSPHQDATDQSKPPTLSVVFIACMCSALLIGYVGIGIIVKLSLGVQLPRWLTVLALFVAIHLCAWFSSKRVNRSLQRSDLIRLSIGCAIAFCLIDEGLTLALQWAGLVSAPQSFATAKAVVATLIDALIVVAMVFLTVPIATRFYGRAIVA